MVSSQNLRSQYLPEEAESTLQAFEKLNTDDKLALFYFIYEKMGDSITPAAPEAAEPELAPILLGDYLELADQEQLQIMRDIVSGADTEYSRAYGALKENNQLLVWYGWAKAMGNQVVDMPSNYGGSDGIRDILSQIEAFGFQDQISLLREIAGGMGYSDVQPIPTQAETGKTASL